MSTELLRGQPGIYLIECSETKHEYVGASIDMRHRQAMHLAGLRKGKHANKLLLEAFQMYGETSFRFKNLEVCRELELLPLKELEHAYERNPELNILKAEGLKMKLHTTPCYYSEKFGLWLRWTKHISSFNALDFADCDKVGSFYVPRDLPPKLTDEQVKAAIEIWLGR